VQLIEVTAELIIDDKVLLMKIAIEGR